MPRKFTFHDTLHALQRAAERGIPEAWVYETVASGSQHDQGHKGKLGGLKRLYKMKHGDRLIVVAAEVLKTDCYILTVYAQGF